MRSERRRPSSAQPLSRSSPSDLRRARAAGVDTTAHDLQRYCELQQQVHRVVAANAPAPSHASCSTSSSAAAASPPGAASTGAGRDVSTGVSPHHSKGDWVPVTVAASEPTSDDVNLIRLLEHVDRRRGLRQSYPSEQPQSARNVFEQLPEVDQVHQACIVFRESDVLPPDGASLLDAKARVRDLLSQYENRSAFKHNAEDELQQWVVDLPTHAGAFDATIAARIVSLEHDQADEQHSFSAVEKGTHQIEAGVQLLRQFSDGMFDTIFDIEDRRKEILTAECRHKARRRSVGTTTTVVVPLAVTPNQTPVSSSPHGRSAFAQEGQATTTAAIPYGCRTIPGELFDAPEDAAKRRLTNVAPSTSSPLSPTGRRSGGSENPGDDSGAAAVMDAQVTALQNASILTAEIDRIRKFCEKMSQEKAASQETYQQRIKLLEVENASLASAIAENRRDVQNVLLEQNIEVVWEEVENGRTAAEFLRDTLPLYADAVVHRVRGEVEANVFQQARTEARVELTAVRAQIQALQRQINDTERLHREALADAARQHHLARTSLEKVTDELSAKAAEVQRLTGSLLTIQAEVRNVKQDLAKATSAERDATHSRDEAEIRRAAAEKQCEVKLTAAQRTAEGIARKVRAEYEESHKRLTHRLEDVLSAKVAAEDALHAQRTTSLQTISALEKALSDAKLKAVDTKLVATLVDDVVGTFGGFVLQHSKRLRTSAIKDMSSALRTVCGEVCVQLLKALRRAVDQGGIVSAHLDKDVQNMISRMDKQCEWELEECGRGRFDTSDPSEALMKELRKESATLRDELHVVRGQLTAAEAKLLESETTTGFRLEAVSCMLKHLHDSIVSLCGRRDGGHASDLLTWKSVPDTVQRESIDALDGFAHWTSFLQLSTETFHTVRRALQSSGDIQRLGVGERVTVVDSSLSSGGAFLMEVQPEIHALRERLTPASTGRSMRQGGDRSGHVLNSFRNAVGNAIQSFVDPMLGQLAAASADAQLSISSSLGHASPGMTPRTGSMSRSLTPADGRTTPDTPHRSSSYASAQGGISDRRRDLATLKLSKALHAIKQSFRSTAWGVVRLSLVKQQFRKRLDALELSCQLLSHQCEQAVLAAKLDRQRLRTASVTPATAAVCEEKAADGGAQDDRAMVAEARLGRLGSIRASMLERATEKLRLLRATMELVVQQAEATLHQQLVKVSDGIRASSPLMGAAWGIMAVGRGGDGAHGTPLPDGPMAFRGPSLLARRTEDDVDDRVAEERDALQRENRSLRTMLEALQLGSNLAPSLATSGRGDGDAGGDGTAPTGEIGRPVRRRQTMSPGGNKLALPGTTPRHGRLPNRRGSTVSPGGTLRSCDPSPSATPAATPAATPRVLSPTVDYSMGGGCFPDFAVRELPFNDGVRDRVAMIADALNVLLEQAQRSRASASRGNTTTNAPAVARNTRSPIPPVAVSDLMGNASTVRQALSRCCAAIGGEHSALSPAAAAAPLMGVEGVESAVSMVFSDGDIVSGQLENTIPFGQAMLPPAVVERGDVIMPVQQGGEEVDDSAAPPSPRSHTQALQDSGSSFLATASSVQARRSNSRAPQLSSGYVDHCGVPVSQTSTSATQTVEEAPPAAAEMATQTDACSTTGEHRDAEVVAIDIQTVVEEVVAVRPSTCDATADAQEWTPLHEARDAFGGSHDAPLVSSVAADDDEQPPSGPTLVPEEGEVDAAGTAMGSSCGSTTKFARSRRLSSVSGAGLHRNPSKQSPQQPGECIASPTALPSLLVRGDAVATAATAPAGRRTDDGCASTTSGHPVLVHGATQTDFSLLAPYVQTLLDAIQPSSEGRLSSAGAATVPNVDGGGADAAAGGSALRINTRNAIMVTRTGMQQSQASTASLSQLPLRTNSAFSSVHRASIASAMSRAGTTNHPPQPLSRAHPSERSAYGAGAPQPQSRSLRRTQSALH